jgi:hypothetical protein
LHSGGAVKIPQHGIILAGAGEKLDLRPGPIGSHQAVRVQADCQKQKKTPDNSCNIHFEVINVLK